MNSNVCRRLSFLLGLTTITMLGSGLSVQAETIDSMSSTPEPLTGTTSNTATALDLQLAKPTNTSAPRVAQSDTNTVPSPGTETTPSPDSAPAPADTNTVPSPGTETTPSPDSAPAPTAAVSFTDVDPSYWAYPFIQALGARTAIAGFPDGTFRPEQPVTRAEFAAMLQKAVNRNPVRQLSPNGFSDVPADYWAASAIRTAYETGFLSGYPDNSFQPNQQIPKAQAITALASGLGLTSTGSVENVVSTSYTDAGQIPSYAIAPVAAATEANLVVNYPDVRTLNPQVALTRAEAAAHLYQALIRLGQVQPLPANVAAAQYIVGGPGISQIPPTTPEEPTPPTPAEETPSTSDVEPGRATRGGSSYFGVGANFGITGDVDLGEDIHVAVFSKIGLLNFLSVRPSAVIGDDPTILIPVTFDLNFRSADALDETFSIAPYAGAGIGIRAGDTTGVGFLLTGGIDVPINRRFTATAAVNALIADDTDVGVWVGVGYNFSGLGF